MTTSTGHAAPSLVDPRRRGSARVITSLALGLFAVLWLYSGIWTLVDLDGARETAERLGYPGWTQAWTGALKIAGVAVILWGRWGTLSGLAFAGFFYDLALAGGAHALRGESDVALVLVALAVTGGAFWADRRRRAGSRTG